MQLQQPESGTQETHSQGSQAHSGLEHIVELSDIIPLFFIKIYMYKVYLNFRQ